MEPAWCLMPQHCFPQFLDGHRGTEVLVRRDSCDCSWWRLSFREGGYYLKSPRSHIQCLEAVVKDPPFILMQEIWTELEITVEPWRQMEEERKPGLPWPPWEPWTKE